MNDYTHILDYYRRNRNHISKHTQVSELQLTTALSALNYQNPIKTKNELEGLLSVVKLYYLIQREFDDLINKDNLHLAFSIMQRCGHHYTHCSTDANYAPDKISVPYNDLKKLFTVGQQEISTLSIYCEGDPFYYRAGGHDLIDIIYLGASKGIQKVSIMHTAPMKNKRKLFMAFLRAVEDTGIILQPELSFHLYHPLARSNNNKFLQNVKFTMYEYLNRGMNLQVYTRSDHSNNIQTVKKLNSLIDMLSADPDLLPNKRCTQCGRILMGIYPTSTLPIGRARAFLQAGSFDIIDHTKRSGQDAYLCPTWWDWNTIYADTTGWLQLCYSTISMVEGVKKTAGTNIYDDSFDKVLKTMHRYWKMKYNYLRAHLRDMIRERPNPRYCPQFLFDKALEMRS